MPTYYLKGYEFVAPSKVSGKKYDAYKNGKYITSFGSYGYSQYKDKIGHYKSFNNNDIKRKKLYYIRHSINYKKETADWFSKKFLW